jgi:hypothetical protein
MTCDACKQRGKTWKGSDPECAFPNNGDFTPANWNCATANALRDLVYEGQAEMPASVDYRYCEDQKYAAVRVYGVDGLEGGPLALWVTWYKNRGGTDQMWLLFDDRPPRQPSAREIKAILRDHGREVI